MMDTSQPIPEGDTADEVKSEAPLGESLLSAPIQEPSEQGASTYEAFTLSDGGEIDPAALEAFVPLAQEMNLNQEQAQKLVDLYARQVSGASSVAIEQWRSIEKGWVEEVRSDPDIGGGRLNENLVLAARAIDAFGGNDLRSALDMTRAGSHPAIVRAFARIGRMIAEDGFVRGHSAGAERSPAEVLYPTHRKSQ